VSGEVVAVDQGGKKVSMVNVLALRLERGSDPNEAAVFFRIQYLEPLACTMN
jgi:hypothetical protein